MNLPIGRKMRKNSQKFESNIDDIINEIFFMRNDQKNDHRFLFLFNSVVNYLDKIENYFESKSEILICLSSHLLNHHLMQVRATALRVIRFLITNEQDVQLFNSLQIPYLICRSIDIVVKNEEERIQALKLIRKIVSISPRLISSAIVKCLVSLSDTSMIDGKPDRIIRSALAILSEIAVLHPELFILNNGVSVITRNVIITDSPRINESLVAVLLHFLENPKIRTLAGIHLECIAASYCDFTYRLIGLMDKNKDIRELRFKCSRLSLLSVLKSWPGVIEFCNPRKTTCLRAIIDVMYLNQLEVRKAILDLFYELFGINQPTWSDEVNVALGSIDPSNYSSNWRLSDGFVAAEGKSVLPSLRNNVPNICDTHQALLIYCLIECGIVDALTAVIVNSDTFISIRSTILLAKILQIVNTSLPENLCAESVALSNLIYEASKGNTQAVKAISTLQSYQQLLRNRPAPVSLYLDLVIQNGHVCKSQLFQREINGAFYCSNLNISRRDSMRRKSFDQSIRSKDTESTFSDSIYTETDVKKRHNILKFFEKYKESERLIKDSLIFSHVDCHKWDFDVLLILFRNNLLTSKNDETQLKLIKTLITYYKPSSNKFSHIEISQGKFIQTNVIVGIELLDFLLTTLSELEYLRILTDFCSDINSHLKTICKKKPHDSLFSPNHMQTTMCQQYFIFIGRISKTTEGLTILKNTDILKNLLHLVLHSSHTIYAKLVISGLDYSQQTTRSILEKALVSSQNIPTRIYATQFLLVLFRVKLKCVEEWGVKFLLNQLKDKERSIQLTALEILEEVCHENVYLLEIVHDWPKLSEIHDHYGKFIMMHFYSVPRGLNHPEANPELEIKLWNQSFNKKYVLFVECENHNALTLNKRNEDGIYNNRNSNQTQPASESSSHLPMHLFGALVRTQKGFDLLQRYGELNNLTQIIYSDSGSSNENECFTIKAALWSLGWVVTHSNGIGYFNEYAPEIYSRIIFLAKNAEFYSVRWTAFHVLNLMSTCLEGADILLKFDWVSVRHRKYNEFPVIEPEVNIKFPLDNFNYEESTFDFTYPSLNTSTYSDFQFKNKEIHKIEQSTIQPNNKFNFKTRSLSESKTHDEYLHRVRFNSGDSNTSGISSLGSTNIRLMMNEKYRRASISGGYSSPQSRFNETNISGYKKLRQIRKNLKSMFSESTSDGLDDIFEIEDTQTEKKLKSLDSFKKKVRRYRDDNSIVSELYEAQEDLYASRFLSQDDKEGRCFMGICLPKNINDLFGESEDQRRISNLKRVKVPNQCSSPINQNDSLTLDFQDLKISLEDEEYFSLQIEASSSVNENFYVHNQSECLRCCRYNVLMKIFENEPMEGLRSSEYEKIVNRQIVLKNVDKMASPIYFKGSKNILIELKQKHPKDFQDICLYSEVCKKLSSCSYRFHVRRFIQELFFGLDWEFFIESSKCLVKKRLGKVEFNSKVSSKNLESIQESNQNVDEKAEVSDKDPPFKQRSRIHTLELDLSCTKNRFPIKRQISTKSTGDESTTKSNNLKSILSPISYSYSFSNKTLYCEQRLKSSQSEMTLNNNQKSENFNSKIVPQSQAKADN